VNKVHFGQSLPLDIIDSILSTLAVCQSKKSKVKLSAKNDDLSCPVESAAAVGVRLSFESTDQGRHVGGQHPRVGVDKQAL